MNGETEIIKRDLEHADGKDSCAFGVSLRGWLALILTLTVCAMSVWAMKVEEPLYSAFLFVMGMYFGKQAKPTQEIKP